jgi:hypothetical protein
MIARSETTCGSVAPSRITARRASFSAVNGSSWIAGWTAGGKFDAEKNTPHRTHIGSIVKLSTPEIASRVFSRLAASSPSPVKVTAPTTHTTPIETSAPRIGMPRANLPKASGTIASGARNTIRAAICATR